MPRLSTLHTPHHLLGLVLACLATLSACETVPVTGRSSLNTFSLDQDVAIGRAAYLEVLQKEPLIRSGRKRQQVDRVMNRLLEVADDPGFEWEVNLIDNDEVVNAFALPGGKMAVYSGLLAVAGDDAGLAVVMGHEIGHVVARHSTERLARSLPAAVLLDFVDLGELEDIASATIDLTFNRPHGRSQESEADHIGLIYMARAGYDPRRAVEFWERMGEATGGAEVSGLDGLLATHPSHGTRIADLQARMPQALEIWRAARAEDP